MGNVVGEGTSSVVDERRGLEPAREGVVDLLEHSLHRTLMRGEGEDQRRGARGGGERKEGRRNNAGEG